MELSLLIFDVGFVARRRKDAVAMFSHHIYTVVLIGLSWITVNHRIGIVVLFLHDLPDILIDLAKCIKYQEHYVKKSYTKGTYNIAQIFGICTFALFFFALLFCRIIWYLQAILYLIYDAEWCMKSNFLSEFGVLESSFDYRPHGNSWQVVLIILLLLLYPLHLFWLSLVLRMIPRILSQQYDDIRSSEGDSEKAENDLYEFKKAVSDRQIKHFA